MYIPKNDTLVETRMRLVTHTFFSIFRLFFEKIARAMLSVTKTIKEVIVFRQFVETRTESTPYPFWASWAVFKKNISDIFSVTKVTKESIVLGQVSFMWVCESM